MSNIPTGAVTSFDTLVADSTKNVVDVPANKPITSDRVRIDVDGSIDTSGVNDIGTTGTAVLDPTTIKSSNPDITLNANHTALEHNGTAGDKFVFRTRQTGQYVSGYEALFGIAFKLSQSLQEGERLTLEFGDGTDGFGYQFEKDSYEVFIRNAGTKAQQSFSQDKTDERQWTKRPLDGGAQLERKVLCRGFFNWYAAGSYSPNFSFTQEEGGQVNETVDEIGNFDDWLTEEVDLPLRVVWEIPSGPDDTNIDPATVQVGTMQYLVRGNVRPNDRGKSGSVNNTDETLMSGDLDGTYEPLLAFKNVDGVRTKLNEIDTKVTQDFECLVIGVDPADTDASSFEAGRQLDPDSTTVYRTTSVTTFPNSGDSVNSPTDGSFRQILAFSGEGGKKEASPQSKSIDEESRSIYPDEIVIVLFKTIDGTSNGDVKWIEYDTQQDF